MKPKVICLDFDGVLHSYVSGWHGADVVSDPPVPGALEFIESLLDGGFQVSIFSSRSHQAGGVEAMQGWLMANGLSASDLSRLDFPLVKPSAWVTLDDRAIQFNGIFPTMGEIEAFKAWNKRG